ncbi:MAG: hypothetical protein HQL60_03620 [Magnetococcales bacterium]|nr:hypothetical protein [Magnetococcales bacterium]
MIALAFFFTSLGGKLLFGLIIVGGFLVGLTLFFQQTQRVGNQLRIGLRLLEETAGSGDAATVKQRFAANWNRFKSGIESPQMNLLASAWAEFGKHLVVPSGTAATVRSMAEPSSYFNERSLFHANMDARFYDALPNFLIGGGIFGTFVGLVAGIFLAQDGMTAGPEEMKQALKYLLGGASTAFLTSIFGIGLSLVFSIIARRRIYWISRLIRSFGERMEACLEMAPPENSALVKIHSAQLEQIAEMQRQSGLYRSSQDGLASAIAKAVDARIGASLTPTMGRLFDTIVQFQEGQKEANQQAMQQALSQLVDKAQGVTRQNTTGFDQALQTLNDNLKRQNEIILSALRSVQEANQGSLLDATQTMREAMDSVATRMANFLQESSSNLGMRVEQAVASLANVATGMKSVQTEMVVLLRESAGGVGGRLDRAITELTHVGLAVSESQQETKRAFGIAPQLLTAIENLLAGLAQIGVAVQSGQEQHLIGIGQMLQNLNDTLRQQNDMMAAALRNNQEITWGVLSEATQNMRDTMGGAGAEMAAQLHDSVGSIIAGVSGRLDQAIAELTRVAAAISDSQRETQRAFGLAPQLLVAIENLLGGLEQIGGAVQTGQDRNMLGFEQTLYTLNENLRKQHEVMASVLFEVAQNMRETMGNAGVEVAALMRESAGGIGNRLDQAIAELIHVAAAVTDAQRETQRAFGIAPQLLEALENLLGGLRQMGGVVVSSGPERSGNAAGIEQTLYTLNENLRKQHEVMASVLFEIAQSVRDAMGGAGSEITSLLRESAGGFGSRLDRAIAELTQVAAAVSQSQRETQRAFGIAPQLVTAIENLLGGLEQIGLAVQSGQEQHLVGFGQTLQALNDALRQHNDMMATALQNNQEVTWGALSAVSQEIRSSMGGAGSEVVDLVRQSTEGLSSRLEQTLHNLNDNIRQQNEAMATALQSNQEVTWGLFSEATQNVRQSMGGASTEMANMLREALAGLGGRLDRTIGELTRVVATVREAQPATGAAASVERPVVAPVDDSRFAAESLMNFASTFEQAQGRFGDMINAMESGAMMLAVAGEKLHASTGRIEALTDSLANTQEAARQTLSAITKSHEQLRAIWHNYEARFEQVDSSLEQTFVHLNNGLVEFSDKVLQFIAGMDDHMGSISEKLGYTIGEFGAKLEDMNDSMSDFLDKMSGKLIHPMYDTAQQIAQAGEKIHSSIQNIDGLSATLAVNQDSMQGGAQATLSAIAGAQERLRATIGDMQQQMDAAWSDHRSQIERSNDSIRQTMTKINSGLSEFSSEKILEFIGGVDDHMENISRQLSETIGDFNARLDDLSDSMKFFSKTMANLK